MTSSPEHSGGTRTAWASYDADGLLYGAIVSGATMGAVSAHADSSTRVAIATFVVLVVYWSAHVYIHALSKQLVGADARPLFPRIVTSSREEVGVLLGGLPVVAAYVLLAALGVEKTTAGFLALIFLVVLLFGVAYVGARRLELTVFASLIEATGAGLLGVLVILMKALLH